MPQIHPPTPSGSPRNSNFAAAIAAARDTSKHKRSDRQQLLLGIVEEVDEKSARREASIGKEITDAKRAIANGEDRTPIEQRFYRVACSQYGIWAPRAIARFNCALGPHRTKAERGQAVHTLRRESWKMGSQPPRVIRRAALSHRQPGRASREAKNSRRAGSRRSATSTSSSSQDPPGEPDERYAVRVRWVEPEPPRPRERPYVPLLKYRKLNDGGEETWKAAPAGLREGLPGWETSDTAGPDNSEPSGSKVFEGRPPVFDGVGDWVLIQRYRGKGVTLGKRDETALAALFYRHDDALRYPWIRPRAGLAMSDLVSASRGGFLEAVKTFDPNKGTAFKTWAKRCVMYRRLKALRDSETKENQTFTASLFLDKLVPGKEGEFNGETVGDFVQATDGYPLAKIIHREALREAYSDCSPYEREIVAGRFNGEDPEDTARKLGRTPRSGINALDRAHRKWRKKV